MLQSMTWLATDNLARSQFRMFNELGEQMRLSEDDQRRALLLSEQEWSALVGFPPGRPAAGTTATSRDAAPPRQRQPSAGGDGRSFRRLGIARPKFLQPRP